MGDMGAIHANRRVEKTSAAAKGASYAVVGSGGWWGQDEEYVTFRGLLVAAKPPSAA